MHLKVPLRVLYTISKFNDVSIFKDIITSEVEKRESSFGPLPDPYSSIIDNEERVYSKVSRSIPQYPLHKYNQVLDLTEMIKENLDINPTFITEWCCGKGYIGLFLSKFYDVPFHGIDYNINLRDGMLKLSCSLDFNHSTIFQKVDVLKGDLSFTNGALNVALHACGGLSYTLLREFCSWSGSGSLVLIPCCYYKNTNSEKYEWMSREYQNTELVFSSELLKFCIAETRGDNQGKKQKVRKERVVKVCISILAGRYVAVPSKLFKSTTSMDIISMVNYVKNMIDSEIRDCTLEDIKSAEILLDKINEAERVSMKKWTRYIEMCIIEDMKYYAEEQGCLVKVSEFTSKLSTPTNLALIISK